MLGNILNTAGRPFTNLWGKFVCFSVVQGSYGSKL